MDWNEAASLIHQHDVLEGTLYRGEENTGTVVRSSKATLEVGPVKWELPERIKFNREQHQWYFEKKTDVWEPWKHAGAQGLPVFVLLDPGWYAEYGEPTEVTEELLPRDGMTLHVNFDASRLFEKMRLPDELIHWCLERSGETHQVAFVWREDKLRAMAQRDFWLTDKTTTVLFHTGVVISPTLLREALN